jgi:hypothetical protein
MSQRTLIMTGATLLTVGSVAVAPASAGTLTYDVSASALAEITINPFLAGKTVGTYAIPGSLSVAANDLQFMVTVLDDPAQYADGEITLDYALASSLLDDAYKVVVSSYLAGFGFTPATAITEVDDIFDLTNWLGGGTLKKGTTETAFTIDYSPSTNALSVKNYDPAVVGSCTMGSCEIDATVSFGVAVIISEFLEFSTGFLADYGTELSPETVKAIITINQNLALAQALGLSSLTLAEIEATLEALTTVVATNPTGTDVGGIVKSGVVTATNKDTQELLLVVDLADHTDSSLYSSTYEEESSYSSNSSAVPSNTTVPVSTTLTSYSPEQTPASVPEPGLVLGFLGVGAWMAKRRVSGQRTHVA